MGTIAQKLMAAHPDTTAAYVSHTSEDVSSSAVRTFSAMSIGTADTNRHVVALVYAYKVTPPEPTSLIVTIGGVTADLIAKSSTGTGIGVTCFIFAAHVPEGTTADVTINPSGVSYNSRGVALYRMIRADHAATDTGGSIDNADPDNDISVTLTNTVASGVIIAAQGTINGANPTVSAGGLSEDFNVDVRSNEWFTGASKANASSGSQTFTLNSATNPTVNTMVVAHWS